MHHPHSWWILIDIAAETKVQKARFSKLLLEIVQKNFVYLKPCKLAFTWHIVAGWTLTLSYLHTYLCTNVNDKCRCATNLTFKLLFVSVASLRLGMRMLIFSLLCALVGNNFDSFTFKSFKLYISILLVFIIQTRWYSLTLFPDIEMFKVVWRLWNAHRIMKHLLSLSAYLKFINEEKPERGIFKKIKQNITLW